MSRIRFENGARKSPFANRKSKTPGDAHIRPVKSGEWITLPVRVG
jgi:hypothetical protein